VLKHFPQTERMALSSIKYVVDLKMILISFIHLLIQNGISHVKFGYAVTRNTVFIRAVVTEKLRNAQQLQ
jgi:hypothetical protein